jgi:phenylpropionate dioxygenase-like ring-hydroxylating dioxygenase large terminal subunit
MSSSPVTFSDSTPTLASLSPSQIAAIRAIPRHDQAKPRSIDARRSAAIFTDPARFRLEQERIFRRMPVVATLSRMLPEPGSVLVQEGYGHSVLLTRGDDGVVRAFLNVCQHKGSKLVETCEPMKAKRLMCPYHAWSYALDGTLASVPRHETFRGLDKSLRNLAALPCREAGGLVWVWLDRASREQASFDSIDAELTADLDALGIGTAHVYGRKSFDLAANWKLVLEPFLEGYHVRRLHASSIGKLYADVPNVTHNLGLHMRQISGKADFTPESLDEEPGENIHKTVTHAYQVFPSTVIVTSPYYISVMLLMPRAVDRTVVEYFMLTRTPPDNDKAADLYARSYELILKVFGTEDFRAAQISHAGLSSGALSEVVYGGLEEAIPMYYERLESLL